MAELSEITLAYAELRRLQNYVGQAKVAHTFYHGYSGNVSPADEMPEKVYWKTAGVLQRLEAAVRKRAELAQVGGA